MWDWDGPFPRVGALQAAELWSAVGVVWVAVSEGIRQLPCTAMRAATIVWFRGLADTEGTVSWSHPKTICRIRPPGYTRLQRRRWECAMRVVHTIARRWSSDATVKRLAPRCLLRHGGGGLLERQDDRNHAAATAEQWPTSMCFSARANAFLSYPTNPSCPPFPRELLEGGKGVGGSVTRTFVYQKWPSKISPTVNLAVSHDGHFGQGGRKQGTKRSTHACPGMQMQQCGGSSFEIITMIHSGVPLNHCSLPVGLFYSTPGWLHRTLVRGGRGLAQGLGGWLC